MKNNIGETKTKIYRLYRLKIATEEKIGKKIIIKINGKVNFKIIKDNLSVK